MPVTPLFVCFPRPCCLLFAAAFGLLTGCAAPLYRWQASAGPDGGRYRVVLDEPQPEPVQAAGLVQLQVIEWFERLPLPNAWFTLTDTLTQATWQGKVSEAGSGTLPLPPGTYTLQVSSFGYNTFTTKPVVVQAGHVLRLKVLLATTL